MKKYLDGRIKRIKYPTRETMIEELANNWIYYANMDELVSAARNWSNYSYKTYPIEDLKADYRCAILGLDE